MGKAYHKRNRYTRNLEGYRGALLRMLPVVVMVGIVPLIVRQFDYENGLTKYAWFGNSTDSVDFFLAWKSLILMLLAFVMAVCVVIRLRKEKRKSSPVKIMVPLLGYGILVFLSACISVNPTFSFTGGHEQFESVWVLLSYVLVVYYILLYAGCELELQVVTDALCVGTSIIGILGTLQGIGLDLFATVPFQKLITTKEFLQEAGGQLQVKFTNNHAVVTLYNPNYVGVWGSMLVPFLGMMLVFEKNKWRRLWHGCNLVLVIITLLSSHSRAGLIASIIAICVALIFAIRKLLKWWFLVIPAINFAVVLVLLVNAYNDDLIFNRLKNIFAPDATIVAEEIATDGSIIQKTGLTEMCTTSDGVLLTYNGVSVQLSLYEDEVSYGFYALSKEGEQMEIVANEDGSEFTFTHPALVDVKFMPIYIEQQLGLRIFADGEWCFMYDTSKESYQYLTDTGKLSDMIMADSCGFKNYQHAFSHRGFIWSRTIPLLKDHIFLGSGPDTFVLEYPQNDYLKMRQNGYTNTIITKPHNWYLQVGVQTGVLSLLCLLVFYGWYAVQSIRLYAFKKLSTQTEAFGIAAFIGSIGYMISGISNDSMVVTAPIFWGIIALGITANMMVKQTRNRKV